VRNNASTWNPPVGQLANGAPMRVSCQLAGETVAGTVRTTSMWVRIGSGRYVSDGYVRWVGGRPDVPWCDMRVKAAPESRAGFIRWAARRAQASWRDHQVPISVSIAQAINESGWGRSSLTRQGNAYFGIKCFGTPGPVAIGCRPYRTSECDSTGCGPAVASFRVYHLASRSFLDHGRFLRVNPRYRAAFNHTGNPDRFAREIHRAGYATDPYYSDKLISLMRQYNLYRYDL
jgi:flagellum-specific peptidoglycan hydrolase FlgJ